MAEQDSETTSVDYSQLAQSVEEFREIINALVAGLVTDGFTDREARALVAGFWATRIQSGDSDG